MKVLAVLLAFLAVLISVVPIFTDCQSEGYMLTLENGKQVPMKCHWTAIAEIGLGVPAFFLGVFLFFSHNRETRIYIGLLGAILGVFIILFPTLLIGVCSSADHTCNLFMKPFLILAGSLVIVISLITTVVSFFRGKLPSAT